MAKTAPQGTNKKAGARPAFRSSIVTGSGRSVLRDDRATPTVVDTGGNQIDVLTDAIGGERRAGRAEQTVVGEGVGLVLHEHVIVVDAERPVRGEAVFQADADH